jgi:hypothetical protein
MQPWGTFKAVDHLAFIVGGNTDLKISFFYLATTALAVSALLSTYPNIYGVSIAKIELSSLRSQLE